jgi:sulfur-carrier protein
MKICVKFFASLADKLQKDETILEISGTSSVDDIWDKATQKYKLDENILVAVDGEYAKFDDIITKDCEVAFFPPVSGG